jgi:hypothetical protein
MQIPPSQETKYQPILNSESNPSTKRRQLYIPKPYSNTNTENSNLETPDKSSSVVKDIDYKHRLLFQGSWPLRSRAPSKSASITISHIKIIENNSGSTEELYASFLTLR